MYMKEKDYGMGEGEDKVAQERVGDGRESRRWEREWERGRQGGIEMCVRERERESRG